MTRTSLRFRRAVVRAGLLGLSLLLGACATRPTAIERTHDAQAMAAARGWSEIRIPTGGFTLAGFAPTQPARLSPSEPLTVYIEGDGLAWQSRGRISPDPTPVHPVALQLALAQQHGAAAYLARPCQFSLAQSPACERRHWTSGRFAPEVIAAEDTAVTELKRRFGARQLILVGFSGGANIAALLAARRTDVVGLVTVAGVLDHAAWTAYHRVSPLSGSLSAVDVIPALAKVRQIHFAGADDSTVPPQLARAFAERFPPGQRPRVRVIGGYTHTCCWQAGWQGLLGQL